MQGNPTPNKNKEEKKREIRSLHVKADGWVLCDKIKTPLSCGPEESELVEDHF